jgi:hypothetical protein
MKPSPNTTDHRRLGSLVEYGMGGQHGPDKMGQIVMEARQHKQDGYLITPLNPGPGEGTMASVWPAHMVSDWQPVRWTYAADLNRWERSYLEITFASLEGAMRALQRSGKDGKVTGDRGRWRIELAERQP